MATLSEGNLSYPCHYSSIHIQDVTTANVSEMDTPRSVVSDSMSKELNSETIASNTVETKREDEDANAQESPVIDIVINNVVCSFNVRSHLNLRQIALHGTNVEYRRESGMLTMKLRNPNSTASIWSSGKIICIGTTSETAARKAARRFARTLQNLGYKVKFANFRIVNVLGTCTMPFGIQIVKFTQLNRAQASYEPELHPGVTYKIKEIKASLKVYSTGSITITAPNVSSIQAAVEHIFPLVYECQKEKPPVKRKKNSSSEVSSNYGLCEQNKVRKTFQNEDDEATMSSENEFSDLPESDHSWDL